MKTIIKIIAGIIFGTAGLSVWALIVQTGASGDLAFVVNCWALLCTICGLGFLMSACGIKID